MPITPGEVNQAQVFTPDEFCYCESLMPRSNVASLSQNLKHTITGLGFVVLQDDNTRKTSIGVYPHFYNPRLCAYALAQHIAGSARVRQEFAQWNLEGGIGGAHDSMLPASIPLPAELYGLPLIGGGSISLDQSRDIAFSTPLNDFFHLPPLALDVMLFVRHRVLQKLGAN